MTPPKIIDALKAAFGGEADVRQVLSARTARRASGIWTEPISPALESPPRVSGVFAGVTQGDRARRGIRDLDQFQAFIRSQRCRPGTAQKSASTTMAWRTTDNPLDSTIGFKLEFRPPNKVVTSVHGFDTSPWPDVDFAMHITDNFSIDNDIVRVESHSNLETDVPFFVDKCSPACSHFWGRSLNPLFYIPAAALTAQRLIIVVANPPGPESGRGVLPPPAFRATCTSKATDLVALYSRVQVDAGGIIAAGGAIPAPREPTCQSSEPARWLHRAGQRRSPVLHRSNRRSTGEPLEPMLERRTATPPARRGIPCRSGSILQIVAGEADEKEEIGLRVIDEDGLAAEHSVRVTVFKKGAAQIGNLTNLTFAVAAAVPAGVTRRPGHRAPGLLNQAAPMSSSARSRNTCSPLTIDRGQPQTCWRHCPSPYQGSARCRERALERGRGCRQRRPFGRRARPGRRKRVFERQSGLPCRLRQGRARSPLVSGLSWNRSCESSTTCSAHAEWSRVPPRTSAQNQSTGASANG